MVSSSIPLRSANFQLDASGVAGFFGGEEAIAAMASVHFYRSRKWLGWYNSPGSYNVAKRYGQLARSRFWDGLFPGPNVEPAVLLGLDGAPGPKYWGIQSGTILPQTTQMGHNFAEYCKSKAPNPTQPWIPVSQDLRKATSTTVMIITVELPHETENSPTTDSIAHIRTTPPRTYLIASIPIGSSIAACVACALFGDWFSFALILLGVLCNGFACLVIGSAKLVFRCPRASVHSPPGNGIVTDANSIILVRGTEHAVNSVVKSRLVLQYGSKAYHPLGAVALALTLQFILQLLLIPQAELFGQIMFLSTLGISWAYNAYLSSIDREELQRKILSRQSTITPHKSFPFPTRTAGVIFTMFAALSKEHFLSPRPQEQELCEAILKALLPNDTPVWRIFRREVTDRVTRFRALDKTLILYPFFTAPELPREKYDTICDIFDFRNVNVEAMEEIANGARDTAAREAALLRQLLNDATVGYRTFVNYRLSRQHNSF
ncbi:hypothetical protein EYR38_003190 [Pleurotus pulmonarius]|nr:hypothetical protein EYR38_003190 [Pleurotus pulmonarius]